MSDQKEKEQPKPARCWDLSNTRLVTLLPLRRMSRSSDKHQAPGEFDTEDPEALKSKQIVSLPGEKSPSPLVISVQPLGESSSRSFLPYDSSFSASQPPPPPSSPPPPPPLPPSNSNEQTSTRRGLLQKCNENLRRVARKFKIPDKQVMRKLGITCGLGSWAIILTKDVKDLESITSFSAASALLACASLFTFFIGYTRLGSACIFSAIYGSFAYLVWQYWAILALFPTTFWIITIAIIIYDERAPSPEI